MAERLSGGNVAIALLANTIATGAALAALILTFGPISGAHFNPAVSLADALERGLRWSDGAAYIVGSNRRRRSRSDRGTRNVRTPGRFNLAACAERRRTSVQRICSDVRFALRDLGMLTHAIERGALRSGRIHHRRLLVHRLDLICESRSNNRAQP